jgi:signal transduction histidine kinase
LPFVLDAAMPALVELRRVAGATSVPSQGRHDLVFWNRRGTTRLTAEVSALPAAGPQVVLVRLVGVAAPPTPPIRQLAHELRSPLAAIEASAAALHGGHLGPIANARQAGHLASMRDTARHALAVVERMLATGTSGPPRGAPSGEPARTAEQGVADVNGVVGEVLDGMAALAARSAARFERALAPQLPPAAIGSTALRQMLINLVANAIEHAGPAAKVSVATRLGEARTVAIAIADSGPGFPAAIVASVMSGAPGDGTAGLGLAITRAIASAAGGELRLETRPDGATATIVLPAAS